MEKATTNTDKRTLAEDWRASLRRVIEAMRDDPKIFPRKPLKHPGSAPMAGFRDFVKHGEILLKQLGPAGDEQRSMIQLHPRHVPGDYPDRLFWCLTCSGIVLDWGGDERPPPRCPGCHRDDFADVRWDRA